MGLLDNPQDAALMQLGLGLLSAGGPSRSPVSLGQAIGSAGQGAMEEYRRTQALQQQMAQRKMQEQMQQMQMDEVMRKQKEAQMIRQAAKDSMLSPQAQAIGNGGPTQANANMIPNLRPQFDSSGFVDRLYGIDPMMAMEMKDKMTPKPIKLGAEESLLDPKTYRPIATGVGKNDIKDGYLVKNEQGKWVADPELFNLRLQERKAGATNIGMPKIEMKMGEGVASQIGPMLKDSKIATQGATKMFDAADRIEKALASNKVIAGPFASKIVTVKQFIGQGNSDSVRQTRQVIRALAESSVEARKELQGQGAVTESEAQAVQKAESGDIDNLTTGELADLAKLNKRAAHYRVQRHQAMLDEAGTSDATSKMVPFFKVPGTEAIMKYNPELPQIGNKPSNGVKFLGFE